MTSSCRALVLCGDGINCDFETAHALELAGFSADKMHCSDLLASPEKLFSYRLLALPGGFSFGDEIASGKVMAVKLRERLKNVLYQYTDQGNIVIGICNGFQILVQLGLLPDSSEGAPRMVSLCHNSTGRFMNKWVALDVAEECGPFFQGLTTIHLPVRHGEGNLTLSSDVEEDTGNRVKRASPLRYSNDINGSFDRIAALTNEKSNVLGLMPHPEAFVRWNQHPSRGSYTPSNSTTAILPALAENGRPHGLQILINAASMLN